MSHLRNQPVPLEEQADNFIKYWGLDSTETEKKHATESLLELINRARKEGSLDADCSSCGEGPSL